MQTPRLIVVTDVAASAGDPVRLVERVAAPVAPGSLVIQLRDRELPARARLALGRRLVEVARSHAHRFVVNDRLDLAVLLGADGVHLPEAGVAAHEARRLLGPDAWISVAAHDPERAPPASASAVVLAPVLAPRKGREPLGLAALRRARQRLGRTTALYALGGVDAASAVACLEAGADGVAVVGAVLGGRDPQPLLAALGILSPSA